MVTEYKAAKALANSNSVGSVTCFLIVWDFTVLYNIIVRFLNISSKSEIGINLKHFYLYILLKI